MPSTCALAQRRAGRDPNDTPGSRRRGRTAQARRPAHQALQLVPASLDSARARPSASHHTNQTTSPALTHSITYTPLKHTDWSALPCCLRRAAGRRAPWASRRLLFWSTLLALPRCLRWVAGALAGAHLGLLGAGAVGEGVDERALALAGRRALARLLARQRRVELAAGRRGHARLPGRGLDLRAPPGFRPSGPRPSRDPAARRQLGLAQVRTMSCSKRG